MRGALRLLRFGMLSRTVTASKMSAARPALRQVSPDTQESLSDEKPLNDCLALSFVQSSWHQGLGTAPPKTTRGRRWRPGCELQRPRPVSLRAWRQGDGIWAPR